MCARNFNPLNHPWNCTAMEILQNWMEPRLSLNRTRSRSFIMQQRSSVLAHKKKTRKRCQSTITIPHRLCSFNKPHKEAEGKAREAGPTSAASHRNMQMLCLVQDQIGPSVFIPAGHDKNYNSRTSVAENNGPQPTDKPRTVSVEPEGPVCSSQF